MKHIRRIIVADELDATSSESKKRSEMLHRFASDLSVFLESSTDLLFVRRISDLILKRSLSSDQKNKIILEDQEKYKAQLHNFQRPGSLQVRLGWPVEEITKVVNKEKNIEALVIGTKAHRGAERIFLGSVAEEVVRSAERPVFIVGPGVIANDYRMTDAPSKNIVVATDLTKKSRPMETYAVSIAQRMGAKLTFYYNLADTLETAARFDYGAGESLPTINSVLEDIRTEASNDMNKKIKRLRAKGIECEAVIEERSSDICTTLNKLCEGKTMIFMGHQSRGFISSTFIGSNVRSMVMSSKIPVVVVRA